MKMSRFYSDRAKGEPYVYGEQPKDKKYIKINTNENPYGPSPKAMKLLKETDWDRLKLYSDPLSTELIDALSSFYGVSKEKIYVGNSSDEVLSFTWLAFFGRGEKVVYPDITYSFYTVYSQLYEVEECIVSLKDDYTMDLETMSKIPAKAVVITNPNAPTGIALTLEEIENFLKNNQDKLVVVDEAYVDFGNESAIKLIDKYDNLLVVQTFSKSRSLAGLRIGFAMGNKELINGLKVIKDQFNPYTLDSISNLVGAEAVLDKEYFDMLGVDKSARTIETYLTGISKIFDYLGIKTFEDISNAINPNKSSIAGLAHPLLDLKDLQTVDAIKAVLSDMYSKFKNAFGDRAVFSGTLL
jgi:histidinol-phosphate aminotransferase